MGLRELVEVVGRRWRIIVATVVGAVVVTMLALTVVGAGQLRDERPQYVASHVLGFGLGADAISGNLTLGTIRVIARSEAVAERVIDELQLSTAPGALQSQVAIEADTTNGLLTVTATAERQSDAIQLARSYGTAVIGAVEAHTKQRLQEEGKDLAGAIVGVERGIVTTEAELDDLSGGSLEAVLAEARLQALTNRYQRLQEELVTVTGDLGLSPLHTVDLPSQATPASADDSPLPIPASGAMRVGIGVLLGLILGLGVAVGVDRLDTRIRTRDDAEDAYGLPVVAEIHHDRWWARDRSEYPVPRDRTGPVAEAYSRVRLALMHMPRWLLAPKAPARQSRSTLRSRLEDELLDAEALATPTTDTGLVLVTSSLAGEGRTTVTANLATSFAEVGAAVAAVDCDSRRPGLATALGAAHLASTSTGREAGGWLCTGVPATGTQLVSPPPDMTQRERAVTAHLGIGVAQDRADLVIVDTGPLLTSNDAAALIAQAEAVILVVRTGMSSRQDAERTRELLANLHAPVAGIVFLDVRRRLLTSLVGRQPARPRLPIPLATDKRFSGNGAPHGAQDGSRPRAATPSGSSGKKR